MKIHILKSTFGLHDEFIKELYESYPFELIDDDKLLDQHTRLWPKLFKEEARLTKNQAVLLINILYDAYHNNVINELLDDSQEIDKEFYRVLGCVSADDSNLKKVEKLYHDYYPRALEIENLILKVGYSISHDYFSLYDNGFKAQDEFITFKSYFDSLYNFTEFLCRVNQ